MWNRLWKFQLLCDVPDGGGGGGSDLTSIISGSLEGVDRGDSGGDVSDDPAPPPAADDPEESEIATIEREILAKNPKMAGQTLAAHRHQAVLTRNRNQWEKQRADYEAKVKAAEEWKQKYTWAEDPQIHEGLQLLALAESDPQAFAEVVLADPRYAEILQLKAAQAEAVRNPMEGRPKPNQRSADGSYDYYDDQGIEDLLLWHGRETEKRSVERAKQELMKEFGPALKDYQQRQAWNTALDTSKQQLEAARTNWHGFKEHEGKIKAALMADQNLSLHDAYIKVVIPELQNAARVNRETLRKELLEEFKGKPKAVTEAPGRQPERTTEGGKLTTEDIIRRELARVRE